MILKFPDLDTLKTALTTNIVPKKVSESAVRASMSDDESISIETSASIPRKVKNELEKLGVELSRKSAEDFSVEVESWVEIFPLERSELHQTPPEQTPVLFDLSNGQEMANLASEILRLDNDRQSFRWLESNGSSNPRALLLVVGPPYYSLLRALDRQRDENAPRAFLEQAPKIWVELGYTHPFVNRINAPEEQMLLLTAPQGWLAVDNAPFHDIYDEMELVLPDRKVEWKDSDLDEKISIPLRLTASGSPEPAELWVLRENAIEELNAFVQKSDNQLLDRLSFAVGEKGKKKTIIVRVRPSRQTPPVLVFSQDSDARGFRPFSKLPNLFLPMGWQLHPPLRRDKVRSLLADDPAILNWLYPDEDGSFQVERLSEDAFRPLNEWVEYIIEYEQEPIQAWIQAMHFDFESFICEEDEKPKPKKPPSQKNEKSSKNRPKASQQRRDPDATKDFAATDGQETEEEVLAEIEEFVTLKKTEPSELELRRRVLEEEFLEFDGGLDIEARQELWPELARLNAQLGNAEDGGICWMNALWHAGAYPTAWVWNWFMTEAHAFTPEEKKPSGQRRKSWTDKIIQQPETPSEVSGTDLDRVLETNEPNLSEVRALAAYVVYASHRNPPPATLLERLNRIQQFLEKHERLLPIRASWLAWSSIAEMTGGDVLALARARDRILERLFETGLRPEQDLPSFLRFSGQPTNQRFRAVREWMTNLCEKAHLWSKNNRYSNLTDASFTATGAYIDLFFAFALARMGELDASRSLAEKSTKELQNLKDLTHDFLLDAFLYRIDLVRENKPHAGQLSPELLSQLKPMDRMQHYAADRLRQKSEILEPHQKIDPYRHWTHNTSDLDRELAQLVDLTDHKQIIDSVEQLWNEYPPKGQQGNEVRGRILEAALGIAPRVQEDFALDMLNRLPSVLESLSSMPDANIVNQARLLERGLFVAAHFDRAEHVQALVALFEKLIFSIRKRATNTETLDTLAGECFRSLRKLGMRDEIDRLLHDMADLILEGKDPTKISLKDRPEWPEEIRALLHVAMGWLYFGRDQEAESIINAARQLLYHENLEPRHLTPLAEVYAATVGRATVEVAQQMLEEILRELKNVKDSYTSNMYYSLSHLRVVESVILAVVNDDFTMGANARRWLDDDEFLVRRRVHHDFRKLSD